MKFADTSDKAIPAYCVEQDSTFEKSKTFDAVTTDWIKQNNFSGSFGLSVLCPTKKGYTIALLCFFVAAGHAPFSPSPCFFSRFFLNCAPRTRWEAHFWKTIQTKVLTNILDFE